MRHFRSLFAVGALAVLCCAVVACGPKKKSPEEVAAIITEMESAIKDFAAETRAFEKAFMDTTKLSMGLADHQIMANSAAVNERKAEYLLGVIDANKDNEAGAKAFEAAINYLDNATIKRLAKSVDTSLMKNSKIVDDVIARNEALEATAEGKMYADFPALLEDGTPTKLSDCLDGKYVILDFWASWCPWCIGEVPFLKAVYEKYHGPEFEIIGVDVADTMDKAKAAMEEHGITWPQIYSVERVNGTYFGSRGIPLIILLGPDGKVIARDLRCEEIEEAVSKYVKPVK
jgi:thiol-disulfide isomerase/thioredoxin